MENSELVKYLLTPVAQVGLIIGLAEVAKQIGLAKRWIPLLDVLLGVVFGLSVYGSLLGYDWITSIMVGLALGLSACGLFSGIKNVFKLERGEEDGEESLS